jgi:hypothetical protein
MAVGKVAAGIATSKAGQNAIKWAFIALLVFVAYRLLRKGLGPIRDLVANIFNPTIDNVVADTTPADGSTAQNSFASQATLIAQGQYTAMQGNTTDETALFNALIPLNGAQLAMVFEKYGVKEGKNLFQWYADELCDSMWCGSLVWYNDAAPGCTAWLDSCYETEFMRALWQKSGIPVTF